MARLQQTIKITEYGIILILSVPDLKTPDGLVAAVDELAQQTLNVGART